MAFEDLADEQFVSVFDSSGLLRMGSVNLLLNEEAGFWSAKVFIKNSIQNIVTERIRLHIYSDAKYRNIIYSSNWRNLVDIETLDPLKDWIGWVRLDFNKENLNKDITYYIACEIDNYVYAEPFYIGLMYDFPVPVY